MIKGKYKRTKEIRKKMSESHKGKHFSEETKMKMSKIHKGNKYALGKHWKYPSNRKGNKNNFYGRKHTKEAKEKNRRAHFGKKASIETRKRMSQSMKGKNSNGGISPINQKIRLGIEFRLWREAVFARDNYNCQKCKEKGIYLHPHHIQNFAQYPELRFAINNGITFCKNCHMKFHNQYGRKNNTREQIKDFLWSET